MLLFDAYGKPMVKNLQQVGKGEKWLTERLREQGLSNLSDVFLATVDQDGQVIAYIKLQGMNTKDFFA